MQKSIEIPPAGIMRFENLYPRTPNNNVLIFAITLPLEMNTGIRSKKGCGLPITQTANLFGGQIK